MDVRGYSLAEVCRLREEYSKENNIKYDFFMFIRPDILCVQPLILSNYIDKVLKDGFFTLAASNVFRRQTAFGNSVISDPRFYDECDLIWISNYGDANFWGRFASSSYRFNRNDLSMNVPIMIDYRLGRDFLSYALLQQKKIIFLLGKLMIRNTRSFVIIWKELS